MKYIISALAFTLVASSAYAKPDNSHHTQCMEEYGYYGINDPRTNFGKIAACVHDKKVEEREQEIAELREFLKENPQYRYPGMALPNGAIRPLDKCWGKDRVHSTKHDRKC